MLNTDATGGHDHYGRLLSISLYGETGGSGAVGRTAHELVVSGSFVENLAVRYLHVRTAMPRNPPRLHPVAPDRTEARMDRLAVLP